MEELIKILHNFNIKIDLVDEKLDIQAPKGVMTEDLLNEIKLYKNELIEFIILHKTKKEKHLFIPKVAEQFSYVLSSSQRRLWLLSQFEGGNAAYNMASVFELKANVIVSALQKAFQSLIERHESLRTLFKEDVTGEVRQFILKPEESNFQLQLEDISKEENIVEITRGMIQEETNYSFDLSTDSLLRVRLVKTSEDTHVLVCVMHHIISDGQSTEIMTNELFALYDSFAKGNENPLPVLALQYKDYATWQQGFLKNVNLARHKSYWLQQFEGEIPILNLPNYQTRPAIKTYNGRSVNTVFSESLFKDFDHLCQSEGSTLFMGLLAAVKVLLYRYTNQNDIVIGSPTAGREHTDLQNQIGFYVNTLALRTQFKGKDSFKEILTNVKKVTLGAYEHQVYPFDELVLQLPIKLDRSRNPLFDVMVTLQSIDNFKKNVPKIGDIEVRELQLEGEAVSKFDMDFAFLKKGDDLELILTYNTDIYSEEFVKRILDHFKIVLLDIVTNPNLAIDSLSYLTQAEKQQLLVDFNDTKVDYPKDKTIIDLFEEQVEKTPDNIAVVFEEVQLTYKQLNEKANQLAFYLRETYKIQADDLIGIKLERSERMILAILGILKSGAAYVPIDPSYPQERIAYIEKDSNCKIVIDEQALEIFYKIQDKYTKSNILKINKPTDLVYVIYTSGTAGNPKGVMVEHKNLVNLIYSYNNDLEVYNTTLTCNYTFDVSVLEIFNSILSGSKLLIPKYETVLYPKEYAKYFIENKINCCYIHPRHLEDISKELEVNKYNEIKKILIGVEPIQFKTLDFFTKNTKIINGYGPTENTICSTFYRVEKLKYEKLTIPIGKPIDNTQIYILDEGLQPVSIGVTGKLYISGDGVSRGYLNKPELTAEKFISNPFIKGTRMYDTGDLGRWLPDGNIEFLGRNDHQVKIRGYRIELGEIETAISGYSEEIQQIVVEAKEINQDKTLVAYYVSKTEIDKSELRTYLQNKLPEYMVPGFYVEIESLPLTPNGKIDRKALPGVTGEDIIKKEYVAPGNAIEQKMVEIWQEVLGVQKIGITDNFFELGGHSLIVVQVINQIFKQLGKTISFKIFFANPTIKALSKELKQSEYLDIPKAAEDESYPLTASQSRLWILSQLESGALVYNMPAAVRFTGTVDFDKFEEAFRLLIKRHEILRTFFKSNDQGEVSQFIIPTEQVSFSITQKSFLNKKNQHESVSDYLEEVNKEPFDLEKAPLIRASLIKLREDEHVFFLLMHHIIGDGWSMLLLISEVVKIYNSLLQGKQANLPELRVQYKDYAVWLNSELQQEKHQASEDFWLNQFSGELPVLDLPSFKKRPSVQTYNGASLTHEFSKSFLDKLKGFSERHQSTLFMTLMTGVKVLLHKYSGQDDIVVGTPIVGREHPDLEHQIGLYLNTLAIRTLFKEQNNFLDLLNQEKETLLGAYEHQAYPFDELVGKLNLKRDMSRSALFDVLVVLQNQQQVFGLRNEESLSGLEVDSYNFTNNIAQFDISFTFAETEGLALSIQYNTDIYDLELIERMFTHFENLLTKCIEEQDKAIESIDYLTQDEKQQLLVEFNDTKVDYPKDKTIIDLFEEQVDKTPDNIAVVFEEVQLTYKQLNEKANQLAHYLREEYSIKPNDFVGVKLVKSKEFIIAVLGILKSGAAYVPIDVSYPEERIEYIEQDSNCKVIIDDEEMHLFHIQRFRYDIANLDQVNMSSDLAYLIYTSGSTGNPKGVMVEHINVVRLVKPCLYFPLDSTNILLSTGSVSFDATTIEFFGTLLNGSRLILTNQQDLLDMSKLENVIEKNQVNSLWMNASWFNNVVDSNADIFKNINQLIVGGDVVSPVHTQKVFKTNPAIRIVNGYGPTENTTFSITFDIKDREYTTIPIGKPISNTHAYIIDEELQPLPIGVTGKIYVSGDGVSRGYLNKPELTAEKFISNPFIKGTRMYDTGDLGRWLPDGNIEFLGRNDHQVKIRGYRIELGEIETAISGYSGDIQQVVVEAKEINQDKTLVAYYVSKTEIDKSEIRTYLQNKLPEYMVPGFYVEIEGLPLTPNGKIDRKALPSVTGEDIIKKEYVAPRNAIEQKMVEIWQEVLGVQKIGITDNFFELGGHSLIVVQVINQISKQLGKTISFNMFFANPTIKAFNKELKQSEYLCIPKAVEDESYPLTSSQSRLWILSQFEGGALAYNMPAAVRFTGTVDFDKFEESFRLLIKRHEILRTYFKSNDQAEVRQFIIPIEQVSFSITQKSFLNKNNQHESVSDYLEEVNKEPFDLEKAPLIRASLIKLREDEHVFFLSLHHIIGDGWSIELLISEVVKNYNSLLQGKQANLPELNIQYKDYAVWLNSELQQEKHQASEDFWLNQFSGELPVLDLPSFKKRPSVQTYNGASLTHGFSKSFLDKLKGFSEKHQSTLFMTLMTGVKVLLHKYSGQDDIVVGTPIAGREHPDLEHQIGLYLNTLPIRTLFKEQNSFLDLLNQEKETLLGAYEHQAYPFDELVGKLNLKRDMSRSALFDVAIVLQNQQQVFGLRNEELLSGLQVDNYNFTNKISQTDIRFNFLELEGLVLIIDYNTDIYNFELINRIFVHFENLLTKCIEEQDKAIENIDYLTQGEKQQLLVDFNDSKVDYPKDKTIIGLFEEQVDKTPDNIAVVFEGVELTYKQLNEKANQLAHYLRETYKIQADDLIGIKLERSEQMILAILGILKSGAAYVPIDPGYPEERIAYIEKDSNCKIVIDGEVMMLFDFERFRYTNKNLNQIHQLDNLAYVIYTSGTTGNPKGVMVEHSGILNTILAQIELFDLQKIKNSLQFASLSFDASISEIFISLLSGSCLFVVEEKVRKDVKLFENFIQENQIEIGTLPPAYLKLLDIETLKGFKCLITAGESADFDKVREYSNYGTFYNAYGPTETSICASIFKIEKGDNPDSSNISIGSPISNTQVYILDESLQPLPIGVAGKLYVSGAGVARGYLNKPELTAEKFISNPFIKGTRMYDTGDLGRWLPDGNIEFLGRNDHQVKIRGYRIELGEIETAISGYSEEIQQVVVEAKEINQDKTLVAYYVSKTEIDKSEIRTYLQNKLPEYMVPGFYVEIESLPLTPNGKIDRKALPSVTGEDIIKKDYVAPRNKEEQLIVDVWTSVLKQEAISVKDSFYNLGGDSIKSIQVASRLRQKGYTVKIDSILRNPIVEDLAKLVQLDTAAISQDIIKGPVVLTPIQKLFFEDGTIINKNYYNQSILLKSKLPINDLLLKEALSILVKHHDALRMSYELAEDGWQQYNLDDAKDCFKISFFDLRESKNPKEELNRLGEDLQSGFNLGSGVLFHIGHFRTDNGDQLALIIHHLVVDGVSWRILLEDFSTIYQALETNSEVQLPLKTDSFQKWASLQQSYAKSAVQQQERTYWENLSQTTVALLPKDFEDLGNKAINKKSLSFALDMELTKKLQTKVHHLYNTEINDVLLTALALGIKETFGVEKSVVQMEGHGREEIIDGVDISRTIGWFTSVYPFVLDISENQHPEIVSVKESLRKVPNKGIGYGILKYLDAPFQKELVPSIQFNYLGDFGSNADGKEDSQFEFSGESIGASKDPANVGSDVLLDVSGMMVSGQLSMSIGYSGSLFKQETIEKLVSSYHEHLCILIKELSQSKENRLTPSDLTFKGLSIEDLFRINNDNAIEDIYELSPLQQGLYYHWLVEESSSLYFMQTCYTLRAENLNINNVREAYQELVNRYDILRTSFSNDHNARLQIVHKEALVDFNHKILNKDETDPVFLAKIKQEDISRGFDLNKPTQMRLQVLDLGYDNYEFIWSHHHIVMDGWCMSILINDFSSILNDLDKKQPISLEKPAKYANYIKWLSKVDKQTSLAYWKRYLDGFETATELTFKNRKRTQGQNANFKSESIYLEEELFEKIKDTCNDFGITKNTFIQGVWGYLLSRYNNSKDVVFGSVVSGRPADLVGVENMVGLFSNTIPVRLKYDESATVKDFLQKLHAEAIESSDFHYVSLAEVQSQSSLGMELINNLVIFENYAVADTLETDNKINIENINVFDELNYGFAITVKPSESCLEIEFRFDSNIFDIESIGKMKAHFEAITHSFVSKSQTAIHLVDYLTQGEKQQLLVDFNHSKVDYPKDKTIIGLFEEQVDKTPDNIAVVFEGVELTYKQLNEKANQLAHYLRETYKIQADDLIGIKLERSEQMILAILGILKSGAAYVPIDPGYPEERIAYIEKDSNCKIVIDGEVMMLFDFERFRYTNKNLNQIHQLDNLAYVIYTSGTTGNPKGVMVEHSGILNTILAQIELFDLQKIKNSLQFASLSFDASISEIFISLLSGSCLFVVEEKVRKDVKLFENFIQENQIEIGTLPPAYLKLLDIETLKGFKCLITAGESADFDKVREYSNYGTFYNAYGPTETSICASIFKIEKGDNPDSSNISIGSPISNTQVYILDESLQPLPIGVAGKLYVSGAGVARGYLNKPELTAEKFISNPFIKGTRMYDTGDLGRWLPDGNIEFLGRNDNQVKIRGYRIELGEIETAISEYSEEIQQVVVEAKEINQDKTLVAYYVSKTEIDKSEIRAYLQNKLPEYMVPGFYVEIESLPLTPNGKIDRKALPSVTGEDIIKKEYVAPRNAIEEKMVEIWQEVLGIEKIGVTDNFFELGGHSLNVIRFLNMTQKYFSVKLTIREFFANPKIENISALIASLNSSLSNKNRKSKKII